MEAFVHQRMPQGSWRLVWARPSATGGGGGQGGHFGALVHIRSPFLRGKVKLLKGTGTPHFQLQNLPPAPPLPIRWEFGVLSVVLQHSEGPYATPACPPEKGGGLGCVVWGSPIPTIGGAVSQTSRFWVSP